jgi:heme/copper-type cytochrome/quinol oxidase subunit 3
MAASVEALNAEESLAEYKHREGINRLGLWLFIGSEVFLFVAIGISRAILWNGTRPDLEQLPALVLTLALLLSSFFMNRAETAVAYGDRRNFLTGILITIVLGTIFFLGVIFVEWPLSGLSPSENIYGAQWPQGIIYSSTSFSGGSCRRILAFCGPGMVFLLHLNLYYG